MEERADFKTRFGQPNGNKPNGGGLKGGGKTFRQRIAELVFMDEAELRDYAKDEKNPAVVRKAALALMTISSVKDISTAADIIESKPVQLIDQRNTDGNMSQEEFLENIQKAVRKDD